MQITESNLLYRRQFLLSRSDIPFLSRWKIISLTNGNILYVHPDLSVTLKNRKDLAIILLGYIYDPVNIEKDNESILEDIISQSDTFPHFIQKIKLYSGQFIFLYENGNKTFKILNDAMSLREIYYCTSRNKIICASQPNLIKECSDPQLTITKNVEILDFHNIEFQNKYSGRFWIGDDTYYEGIKHLLPNHYLDVSKMSSFRYWPNEILGNIGLQEAVHRSCSFIKGILKAAANRNELMMAITAGNDSRTLLAASKEIKDKIYFFINKHDYLNSKHPDIDIPTKICNKINVPFHIHNEEGEIDTEFSKIFFNNTFIATNRNLPAIYNVYFKNHSHRLNILGVGEIGRTYFGEPARHISAYSLARMLLFKNSSYAVDQCQRWLDKSLPVATKFNINVLTLLYWEQKLGNWGAVGNSESDIAIEEFDPFSSHYLLETWLQTPKKYTKYQSNILFKEMIKEMWPELLEFPINPPYGKSEIFRTVLKKIGLLQVLKKMILQIDKIKYEIRHSGIILIF